MQSEHVADLPKGERSRLVRARSMGSSNCRGAGERIVQQPLTDASSRSHEA